MTLGYGISGIGWNPLGNVGLGMSGQFGSYDAYMPSMYGMTPSMYGMGMNPSIFGMNGMYGMYNPSFMANMYQQVEASQAMHSGNMHELLLNNEVSAHRDTDSALVKKILTNAELLAIIIKTGTKEETAIGLAQQILKLNTPSPS